MSQLNHNYEKNIQALKNVDIVLATKVIQSALGQSFELTTISEEHQLYNVLDHMHERAMYNNIVDELQTQITTLKSQINNPFVYLFGVGNGYTLPILLNNSNHKRITVFEVESELLFVAFHIYDLSEAITTRRLRLFSTKSFGFAHAVHLFQEHQAYHHARSFELIPTALYYSNYFSKEFIALSDMLTQAFSYHLSLIRPLELQLQFLQNQHNNLNFQLLQSRLESFQNIKNATAIIINQKLDTHQITALKTLQNSTTLICSNQHFKELLDQEIQADIVVSFHNDSNIWESIDQEIQSSTIEVFVNHLEDLSSLDTATQKFICHTPIEYYFETQTDQKVHFHDNALCLALEASSLLGHTQTLIIDDTLKHDTTPAFQNLAYLISYYKERMKTLIISDTKIEALESPSKSFDSAMRLLQQQTLKKQNIMFDAYDEDIKETKKYRQELKVKHLLTMSLSLLELLQNAIVDIQPWYEALNDLEQEALLAYYSDGDIALHIDLIAQIRQNVQEDKAYQKFYHDFLHPTMLLTYIEMANIHSLSTLTPIENRSKNIQWAIINYQWLNQLHHSVAETMELLQKQLQN